MIGLLLLIALIGVTAWALVTFLPMPSGIKTLIIFVAIFAGIILALNAFGVHLPNPGVPRLN